MSPRFSDFKVSRLEYAIAACLAVVARLAFWLITQREFEDALITVAHAQNAADGMGLVHHLGDGVVHGFTSALSVLVPLLGEVIVPGSGLNVVRAVSLVAGAGTVVVALMLAEDLRLSRPVRWVAVSFLIFNGNLLLYGMAGMETQIAVFCLLLSALFVVKEAPAIAVGASIGLTVLARPDFIIWGAAVIGVLLIRDRSKALRVGAWSALAVAPWVVFTTLYYGSPIPNTIGAKSQIWGSLRDLIRGVGFDAGEFASHVTGAFGRLLHSFAPFFDNSLAMSAPIPRWLALFVSISVLLLAIRGALSLRTEPRWWPILVFAATYALYRVLALPERYFDWYVPPFTAVVVLLAAKGLQDVSLPSPIVQRAIAWLLVVGFAFASPWTIGLERTVAEEIDRGVRRPLAEHLDTVARGESVVAESAGYIGFYSDVVLWDFPGLTSQASREALADAPDPSLEYLVNALRPDWIVLRPFELGDLEASFPETALEYVVDRRFERAEVEESVSFLGYTVGSIDESFIVLRRRG